LEDDGTGFGAGWANGKDPSPADALNRSARRSSGRSLGPVRVPRRRASMQRAIRLNASEVPRWRRCGSSIACNCRTIFRACASARRPRAPQDRPRSPVRPTRSRSRTAPRFPVSFSLYDDNLRPEPLNSVFNYLFLKEFLPFVGKAPPRNYRSLFYSTTPSSRSIPGSDHVCCHHGCAPPSIRDRPRLRALAADFVRRRVAVIVAQGNTVAAAAKEMTATIPIG
jgi:hypothetical protein